MCREMHEGRMLSVFFCWISVPEVTECSCVRGVEMMHCNKAPGHGFGCKSQIFTA